MGFPFLTSLCIAAGIVIWFVYIENGRGNRRNSVEDDKLIRVAKEPGLITKKAVEAVATSKPIPESDCKQRQRRTYRSRHR